MNENLIKKYGLGKVALTGLAEFLWPSEGEYRPVAPSGNWLYFGPPLKERIEKRLEKGDKNG